MTMAKEVDVFSVSTEAMTVFFYTGRWAGVLSMGKGAKLRAVQWPTWGHPVMSTAYVPCKNPSSFWSEPRINERKIDLKEKNPVRVCGSHNNKLKPNWDIQKKHIGMSEKTSVKSLTVRY
jgi:hypothetical protein